MLLRRVIEHVRRQEWTAIGLDFVIVVIGVFVGIQAANWNQDRADARLGRAYGERLAHDLGNDLESLRAAVSYYGAVLESVQETDRLLADPGSDPQALVVQAYRATEVIYSPPARATWDGIVSSGDTGLLPTGVAAAAAEYYAFDTAHDSYEGLVESAYRRAVRTTIPLPVQQALRAGCSDLRNARQQIVGFMPECKLEVAPELIRSTAAALRANPAVRANLRYQYSDLVSADANLRGDAMSVERALEALGARLRAPAP